jgi:hypothetical protein
VGHALTPDLPLHIAVIPRGLPFCYRTSNIPATSLVAVEGFLGEKRALLANDRPSAGTVLRSIGHSWSRSIYRRFGLAQKR